MKIYLHGTPAQLSELSKVFEHKPNISVLHDHNSANLPLNEYDILIDALLDTNAQDLHNYAGLSNTLVLAGCNLMSLTEMVARLECPLQCCLAGFNNWNTFIDRPLWELSYYDVQQQAQITNWLDRAGISFRFVADRVGLVVPRVLAMIINEAYFTLQERTADKAGINAAMRLGTNYPFGPFEWAEKIGLKSVFDLLEAVYNDTHDERYKACALLKTEAMRNLNKYV